MSQKKHKKATTAGKNQPKSSSLGCVAAERLETALQAWEARAEFELGVERLKLLGLETIQTLPPAQREATLRRLREISDETSPFAVYDQGIKKWAELRDHLLRARPGTLLHHDFHIPSAVKDKRFGAISTFPPALHTWLGHSKRVYAIPENLQVLLHATSLQDVTLGDLRLPFPSFALSLAIPIVDELGNSFDTILISQNEARPDLFSVQIFVIGQHTEEHVRRLKACAREVSLHLKRRNGRAAEVTTNRWINAENDDKEYTWPRIHKMVPTASLGLTIAELFRELTTPRKPGDAYKGHLSPKELEEWKHLDSGGGMHEFRGVVYGIVFNTILYLKTLGTTLPFESAKESRGKESTTPGMPDLRTITDGALLCKIADAPPLPLEVMQRLRGGYRADRRGWLELSAHFRTGHWRRPPGFGDIPFAEKTVWVRPTLVRRDRLPEAGLPDGRVAAPKGDKPPNK